jgi:hypothetical protein
LLRPFRRQEKVKWMHHCLKSMHKALKLAKLQEVRVVTRRLKKAQQLAEAAGGASEPGLACWVRVPALSGTEPPLAPPTASWPASADAIAAKRDAAEGQRARRWQGPQAWCKRVLARGKKQALLPRACRCK